MKKSDSSGHEESLRFAGHYPELVKKAQLPQGTMIRVAHNDVVQHLDFKELTCANEVAGHFDVRFRWLWLTARVVVHEDDGGSSGNNSGPEDHGCVHEKGVFCAHREQLVPFDPSPGIE